MRLLHVQRPPTTTRLLLAVAIPIGAGCGQQTGGPTSSTAPPEIAAPGPDSPVLVDDEGPRHRPGKPTEPTPLDPAPIPPPAPAAEPPGDEEMAAMTAEELVGRARELINLDDRLRLLEAALEKDPDLAPALLLLAEAAERKGLSLAMQDGRRDESKPYLYRAAEAARGYLDTDPQPTPQQQAFFAMVFYNEGCNFALDDQPDRAIASIREALALGFRDPIIHNDPELDTLRDRDDFRELARQVPRGPGEVAEAPSPGGEVE